MLKYVRRMRILWFAATIIPFAVAFLLSWLFGSPGGWEAASQVKLFFLFLQVGFITAFFCSHRLYQAAMSLWATILLLWVLSLVVPYLASLTGHWLDMADLSFEMSTPLYLFLSCLSAAWLLPGRGRTVVRILCLILIVLYMLIQFTYVGYYFIAHSLLSLNMMLALAQTNLSEAMEYIRVNIPYAGLAAAAAALFCLGWLIFRMSRLSFIRRRPMSRTERIIILGLFAGNLGIAALSAMETQIAHVVYETKDILDSFREYKAILDNRKHMRITDEETLARLRDVPDGVYVLVIGESLDRDHMHVYGYPRETTPFQTEAAADPDHYLFFDKAYSCYTQTVQVLTYALTEKNQYNDIELAEAYSIIDMARAAGFKTTWISNQSRYGVWDTPIGAIGSTCDVQYWVNEYIGKGVMTEEYDEALIPYLRKVNPDNRRQLIVVHLMGSHISYWDRYPSSFYYYPVNYMLDRDTAQIMTDEYDNTVRYNDYVMKGIMDTAVNHLGADGVLYFSDHGEKVTERPGHNADMFDFTMVHIPLWVYTSDRYREVHPDTRAWMESRIHTPFTNDMIYDTFLGLMGLREVHYDPRADLFGEGYDKDVEDLTTMYGRERIAQDLEGLAPGHAYLERLTFPEDAAKAKQPGTPVKPGPEVGSWDVVEEPVSIEDSDSCPGMDAAEEELSPAPEATESLEMEAAEPDMTADPVTGNRQEEALGPAETVTESGAESGGNTAETTGDTEDNLAGDGMDAEDQEETGSDQTPDTVVHMEQRREHATSEKTMD